MRCELERSTPLIYRVIFSSEYEVEVEEICTSPVTPSSHIPLMFLVVILYVGTPTQRPKMLVVSSHFILMTTIGNTVLTMSTSSFHNHIFVEGGGTISLSTITPSISIFGSTSIPYSSGCTQEFSSHTGSFLFGMPYSVISSVPFTISLG